MNLIIWLFRKIYWSVLEPFAAIEIANLDGSERRALVLDAIYSPDSIAIDEPNRY